MEPQASSLNTNLRLLCSYGGQIIPLPPANSIHYVGGETRLVVVSRGISFLDFFKLLSDKHFSGRSFSLKYKLPDCDFDSLITIADNDDLQNMITEYDSIRFRRIRLFLFPLSIHPRSTRQPVSVNRLLGLESPIQKISFTSSSSVLASPIFPPNNLGREKVDATTEENRRHDVADDAGGVSERGTEVVEIQDQQPRPMIQEPFPHQQQQPLIICYLPVWSMQPHMVNYPVAAYTLSPATDHPSALDPVSENQGNGT